MTKTIQVGAREIVFTATAFTKYRYKSVFGKELLVSTMKSVDTDTLYIAEQVGYIMAKEAEGNARNLSLDGFEEWMSGFEPLDFIGPAADIINLFATSAQPTAEAKKKEGQ